MDDKDIFEFTNRGGLLLNTVTGPTKESVDELRKGIKDWLEAAKSLNGCSTPAIRFLVERLKLREASLANQPLED